MTPNEQIALKPGDVIYDPSDGDSGTVNTLQGTTVVVEWNNTGTTHEPHGGYILHRCSRKIK